jgi:hypothetical protein
MVQKIPGKIALFSDELDWALVRIQDTRFMQRNEAVISTDLQIQPSFINFNSELPRRKAFLVGGVSGPREVSISGTMSSIMFPWARTLQTVWTIEFPAGKFALNYSLLVALQHPCQFSSPESERKTHPILIAKQVKWYRS